MSCSQWDIFGVYSLRWAGAPSFDGGVLDAVVASLVDGEWVVSDPITTGTERLQRAAVGEAVIATAVFDGLAPWTSGELSVSWTTDGVEFHRQILSPGPPGRVTINIDKVAIGGDAIYLVGRSSNTGWETIADRLPDDLSELVSRGDAVMENEFGDIVVSLHGGQEIARLSASELGWRAADPLAGDVFYVGDTASEAFREVVVPFREEQVLGAWASPFGLSVATAGTIDGNVVNTIWSYASGQWLDPPERLRQPPGTPIWAADGGLVMLEYGSRWVFRAYELIGETGLEIEIGVSGSYAGSAYVGAALMVPFLTEPPTERRTIAEPDVVVRHTGLDVVLSANGNVTVLNGSEVVGSTLVGVSSAGSLTTFVTEGMFVVALDGLPVLELPIQLLRFPGEISVLDSAVSVLSNSGTSEAWDIHEFERGLGLPTALYTTGRESYVAFAGLHSAGVAPQLWQGTPEG